jgi:hypothetical protein
MRDRQYQDRYHENAGDRRAADTPRRRDQTAAGQQRIDRLCTFSTDAFPLSAGDAGSEGRRARDRAVPAEMAEGSCVVRCRS